MSQSFILRAGHLSLADLRGLERGGVAVALNPAADKPIDASVETVRAVIREHRTVYGVNTGFGSLARTRIADAELTELQRRLVLSHAAGTGPALPDPVVRLALLLKANGLARGHSGVRREAIDMLLKLYAAEALPVIPAKGSVGASGDLAPLAHMTAAMIGQGEIKLEGEVMPAEAALSKLGLQPIVLEAKEGLALLNGTQVSTALAAAALLDAERLFQAALISGSLSVDAAAGSDVPFDPRIQAVRGQPGQIEVARLYRAILENSEIRRSHLDCDRVQDPYSLRCQPQVMGAALDMLRFAAGVIEREMNAVSDNPLVFADSGEILSGGNFHAEPVAMAADAAAIALSEVGSIAERRIALLTDSRMSGLAAFLVPEPGLNSGFMIAHVTAAALASENKGLSHPASVDSLPTSANQEDHVSMATWGARRLHDIAGNVAAIIAIELLAAAQGVEMRRPLKTSPRLEPVLALIRTKAAFMDRDRAMAHDIESVKALIEQGAFRDASGFSLFA
jgi:histidine ammonia-lyase